MSCCKDREGLGDCGLFACCQPKGAAPETSSAVGALLPANYHTAQTVSLPPAQEQGNDWLWLLLLLGLGYYASKKK
jgi:hypothetical protein